MLLVIVPHLFYRESIRDSIMNAERERELIRLWNRLRLLQKEGRPTAAVRRQIEKRWRRERKRPDRTSQLKSVAGRSALHWLVVRTFAARIDSRAAIY